MGLISRNNRFQIDSHYFEFKWVIIVLIMNQKNWIGNKNFEIFLFLNCDRIFELMLSTRLGQAHRPRLIWNVLISSMQLLMLPKVEKGCRKGEENDCTTALLKRAWWIRVEEHGELHECSHTSLPMYVTESKCGQDH